MSCKGGCSIEVECPCFAGSTSFRISFHEAGASRRDARIRFLHAQVEILRRKLGGNRVIPSPDDCARLLAIGSRVQPRCRGRDRHRHSTDLFSMGG